MNPDVVVVHDVQRDHGDVVLDLFAKRIGQSGVPSHQQ